MELGEETLSPGLDTRRWDHQEARFPAGDSSEAAAGTFRVTPIGHRKLICDGEGKCTPSFILCPLRTLCCGHSGYCLAEAWRVASPTLGHPGVAAAE